MKKYHHVLHATDLGKDYTELAEQAAQIADSFEAEMSIVHIMPALETYGYPIVVDNSVKHTDFVKEAIDELGEHLDIPKSNRLVKAGSVQARILEIAKNIGADLIVMGNHEHNVFSWLLGSNADSVKHHTGCDVMMLKD